MMDDFYRMTPLEVAWGWVGGFDDTPVGFPAESPKHPLEALATLLLPALQRPPCFVTFSGGRDSSAILAVAVELARREGLAPPVAMTRVFPDVPESLEDEWQEQVIRHLGVTEWERIKLTDEHDLLGPTATESLRRHGLVWPPALHTWGPFLNVARGGTVVTGEGGDEIFGRRRITPLTGLLARKVHPRKRAAGLAIKAIAPRPVRRRIAANDASRDVGRPWLRDPTLRAYHRMVVADEVAEPLWWDRSIRNHLRRRANREGIRNFKLVADLQDVSYLAPFLDPVFVEPLARHGGRFGYPGRAAAMTSVFGDLLPSSVLRRESKAEFTGTMVRRHCRAFIDRWRGDGVDTELVDPAALRQTWQAERPHAGALPLLQAAWLAVEG